MSFGHAAYFGLGAYGAGLTLKYLAASTPLAMLMGTLLGGVAGTMFGLLIVRRRGVYFAMVTVAFGQIAFYIAYTWNDLTGGYDGLRGFSRAPLHLGFATIDITNNEHAVLLLPAVRVRRRGRRCRACCWPRRSAARCWRSGRTNGARASSAFRSSGISGCRSRSPASSPRWPVRCTRC